MIVVFVVILLIVALVTMGLVVHGRGGSLLELYKVEYGHAPKGVGQSSFDFWVLLDMYVGGDGQRGKRAYPAIGTNPLFMITRFNIVTDYGVKNSMPFVRVILMTFLPGALQYAIEKDLASRHEAK